MPIHGKQHPEYQRKPINYDRDTTLPVHGGTGRFFFFSRRDGAGVFFSEVGRGGVFFSEAGRGGCFFFRGGTGWLFFFSTGRDGAVFFFFFEGRDGTVVFGGGIFSGGTGQNRYTVPPKAV